MAQVPKNEDTLHWEYYLDGFNGADPGEYSRDRAKPIEARVAYALGVADRVAPRAPTPLSSAVTLRSRIASTLGRAGADDE